VIENFPPYVVDTSKLNADRLAHMTRNFINPTQPGARIAGNYDAALAEIHWLGAKVNNTHLGRIFEICWWDALIACGVHPMSVRLHVDVSGGHHAEADLLGHAHSKDVALLVKTSFRERWKQPDRDALIIERIYWERGPQQGRYQIPVYVMTLREQPDRTAMQAINHARQIQQMFHSHATVASVLDEEVTSQVIRAFGGTVE